MVVLRGGPIQVGFGFPEAEAQDLVDEIQRVAGLHLYLVGSDFTDGASSEPVFCGCGEPITEYDGVWLHIINPELRGTDDHDAHP